MSWKRKLLVLGLACTVLWLLLRSTESPMEGIEVEVEDAAP